MIEILSKKSIDSIYKEITKNDYKVNGQIEGLTVGLEEMLEKLATQEKKLLTRKEKFKLDTLIFETNNSNDVKLFFENIGNFNEGSMEMIVYTCNKKSMIIEFLDGEQIKIERFE